MDCYEGRRTTWWKSARAEVRTMATVVMVMAADVGAPLAPVLFASDAQGAGEGDDGGFGVVATDVDSATALECLRVGRRPGYSVTELSVEFTGLRSPDRAIQRNIPFTRLPRSIFNEELHTWHVLQAGRWSYADHITLGEGRAVNKLLGMLAAHPGAHRMKVISLQDNMAAASAFANGRSAAPGLKHILRRRAAWSIAARLQFILPWTGTLLMPADEASRLPAAVWAS